LLEAKLTRKIAGISYNNSSNFVQLKRTKVAKGLYDPHLLQLWASYDEKNGSENIDPSEYSANQLYLVLVLEFCGSDLEHTDLIHTTKDINSVLLQLVLAIAQGEQQSNFEHRDLHWGNVLVDKPELRKTVSAEYQIESKDTKYVIKLNDLNLKVTIIDFTLSRVTDDSTILFNNLDNDPEIFQGLGADDVEGDLQFDIYRSMRDMIKSDWSGFHPKTNVLVYENNAVVALFNSKAKKLWAKDKKASTVRGTLA
jgi:serine/threonine-protein kinase haspin